MEKIILIGGGGHCRSIIDSISNLKEFDVVGIVDKNSKKDIGLGIDIIGSDKDFETIYKSGVKSAVIAIGSIGNSSVRIKLYNLLKSIGYSFPIIIDKTAIVSSSVAIEEGVFIGKGAIINTNVVIKKQSIINSGSIVEHDCKINDFVHLAPGVTLSGGVCIGERTHIGTNSTIIQNINVGSDVIVGAGTVVIRDIKDGIKVYGNPGRKA